jgi:redox-sensitive bicupin YhaK (pirin superfamily)
MRHATHVIPATATYEGEGFLVHRPFPTSAVDHIDPFLLLDEMGPMELAPGEAKGAPDHPHRGFETVTYLLEGSFEHEDSAGHKGKLGPGDVQWMTAGSGVIHSEMPSREVSEKGGRVHGFQLWVNLPANRKMTAPRYQEFARDLLPTVRGDGVTVRVIAGTHAGARSPIETTSPIAYLHVKLDANASITVDAPKGHHAMVYVIHGAGTFGENAERARNHELVAFGAGDGLRFTATEPLEALVLTGKPLDEPVRRAGPFVMSTRADLMQAFEDFHDGKFAQIAR